MERDGRAASIITIVLTVSEGAEQSIINSGSMGKDIAYLNGI